MKALVFAAVLSLAAPAYAEDTIPFSPKHIAEVLSNSVVAVIYKSGIMCSASKIGPHTFLTARHCVEAGETLRLSGGRTLHIQSVLIAQQEKPRIGTVSGRHEDWAVLNTVEDDDAVASLQLACGETPYLGQELAYAGYPDPTQFSIGFGRITTVQPMNNGANGADYGMDVHAAPGASGSPILSLDTGKVIGILTEGISNSRVGAFMVGFESVAGMDACDPNPSPAGGQAPKTPMGAPE